MNQDAFKDIPSNIVPILKNSLVIGFIIFDLIYFLYIRNLVNLMKLVSPSNRRIEPSRIWLLMITFLNAIAIIPILSNKELPKNYDYIIKGIDYGVTIFTLIFTFYMVNKISESLDVELKSRRVTEQVKPTLYVGMFMCMCNTLAQLVGNKYVSIIGELAASAGLVAWIFYWVKTHEYKKKLESLPPAGSNLNDLGIF
jgi:hypothetical protein